MTTMESTSSPSLVIVSGSHVTTWDCLTSREQSQTLYPHGGIRVADATWNHNAQVLATVSAASTDEEEHNNVVLTAAESGTRLDSLQHNQNWNRPAGIGTSVGFGGKSRYLAIGDDSGAVCLWDLKKRSRVRQFFHEGYASRQVSVDPTDTSVLSLSHAFLSVYNLREGNLSTTCDAPGNNTYFTKYHTSPLETNITAIGTRDGSVLVYDIQNRTRNTPILNLDRRQSRNITGVQFSTVNPQLLGTSSADGTLQFFDIRTGETIQELASLSSPITSLSMHAGGINCAIGSESGEVLVYDLRQTAPLASTFASKAVTCLQYAPIPKPKQRSKGTQQSNSKPKTFVDEDPRMDSIDKASGRRTNNDILNLPSDTSSLQATSYSGPSPSTQSNHTPPVPQSSAFSPNRVFQSRDQNKGTSKLEEKKSEVDDNRLKTPLDSKYSAASRTSNFGKSPVGPRIQLDEVRNIVTEEVENLRDDMEEAIRNLHMDMISQFHQQSQELNNVLSAQLATIDRLTEENQQLREENELLRARRSNMDESMDR